MFSLFVGSAWAATFTTVAFPVIDPTAAGAPSFIANGVGAPTVAWDPDQQRYLMFFETRIGAATADCPAGEWAIGVAGSADGVTWDVWPDPLVAPGDAGTPYRCVAAHPAVLYENGALHLWFKAEQGVVPANCGYPWGCANYSGVGYASVIAELDDKADEIAAKEQEIVDTTADRDEALADFHDGLVAYRADLETHQSVFACLDEVTTPLPVCAPCDSLTLTATTSTFEERRLCQNMSVTIPATLTSQDTTSAHLGRLLFRTGTGDRVICYYPWTLATGAYTFNRCEVDGVVDPSYAVGTVVSTDQIRNARITNGTAGVTTTVTFTAVNAQSLTGSLIFTVDDLIETTGAPDPEGTELLLPELILDLEDMRDYLEQFGTDPQLSLYLDTIGLIADAAVLLALQDELEDLAVQLAQLEAYTQEAVASPVPNAVALTTGGTVFGYPNVAKVDGQYVMLVQNYPHLWRATGTSPDAFTLDAASAVNAGAVTWAQTEVLEPGFTCTGDVNFPLLTWIGGRRVQNGVTTTAGLSDTLSDGVTWLFNVAASFVPGGSAVDGTWTNPDLYRHFDAVRSTNGQTRMWYSERVGGINKIGLMSTTSNWTHTNTQNRDCDAL